MKEININIKTFFIGLLVVGGIYLAYELRSILIILFISFIIFSTLKPIVDFLEKKGLNRVLSIALVYLLAISIFLILFITIINGVIQQIKAISLNVSLEKENISSFIYTNLPFLKNLVDVDLLSKSISEIFDFSRLQSLTSGQALTQLIQNISPIATEGISYISKFIGGLVSLFMVIFLSIYMVMPRRDFYEGLMKVLPDKYAKKSDKLLDQIRTKLGAWTMGQVFLMIVIGVLTYIVVLIPTLFIENYKLGQFALIIAIIAGLLEAIPNVGPLLTLIITVLLTIITGGSFALILYIVIMFTLIQQAESLFIVPAVMKRAIDISPILSIIAVLAGFQLGGPLGALIAVPIMGIIQIIVLDFSEHWKK